MKNPNSSGECYAIMAQGASAGTSTEGAWPTLLDDFVDYVYAKRPDLGKPEVINLTDE